MADKTTPPTEVPSITIEGARFVYRPNFSGRGPLEGEPFNPEKKKFFNVELPSDWVPRLLSDGWNVKYTKETENYPSVPYLEVGVGFAYRPPTMILRRGNIETHLDEITCSVIDTLQLEKFDVVLRPFQWEVQGNTGVKAYLQTFYGFPVTDDILAKYANYNQGD